MLLGIGDSHVLASLENKTINKFFSQLYAKHNDVFGSFIFKKLHLKY